METKKEYILEILPDNQVQVLIQTIYFKPDGTELVRENWRTCLKANDLETAREVLDDRAFAIVEATWSI